MTAREVAIENEILRGVVGSTSHGTAIEGQDDRDEMGVGVNRLWVQADWLGGWACCIEQGAYGHRARKATWQTR